MDDEPLEDFAAALNDKRAGFNQMIGLRFVRATREEVVAELTVEPSLHQPYGLVHGGVYASMAETVASVGAALHAMAEGRNTVGLDNSTNFLRATREGTLTARATPLATGRRTHVWEVDIRDDQARLVAKSRVRLLCIEGDAPLAGERVTMKQGELKPQG